MKLMSRYDYVYLKQPGHHVYLGTCGHEQCGGSKYGVVGLSGKIRNTQIRIEMSGDYINLVNPPYNAYIGMCGKKQNYGEENNGVVAWEGDPDLNDVRWEVKSPEVGEHIFLIKQKEDKHLGIGGTESCGNSLGTRGYPTHTARTMWEIELPTDAHQYLNDLMTTHQYVYLKQPDHEIYLGICSGWRARGYETCGDSKYGVAGYKKDRLFRFKCRWKFEVEGGHIYLKNLDLGTYLGMCGHKTRCHDSKYGVHSYEEKNLDRNKWEVCRVLLLRRVHLSKKPGWA